MSIGKKWPCEADHYQDPQTGANLIKLTEYRCNTSHAYFTNNSFYDNDSKFVFASGRENKLNLFSMDYKTFEITQLTDLYQTKGIRADYFGLTVDGIKNIAYFMYDKKLFKLDLMNYDLKIVYTVPEDFRASNDITCINGGKYAYMSYYEDLSKKFNIDLARHAVGFVENWENKPLSKIIQIDTETDECKEIFQENYWIGHVLACPTDSTKITFCHEGPWVKVDNRIWGMDTTTGKVWKIRERHVPHERIGHEYWYKDGSHVGYHGEVIGENKLMGKIRFDNTDEREVAFNFETGHIFSDDENLIVGDGGKHIRLWQFDGKEYKAPKALCVHGSSMKTQDTHPHPRITPDGKYVMYASDRCGYINIYLAEIPEDVSTLPDLSNFVDE